MEQPTIVRGNPLTGQTAVPTVPAATFSPRAMVVALRPRQWAKNGLLFVALAFTANLHQLPLLGKVIAAFAIFCALSSAGYLLNDVADVRADRLHPTKRFRPIAAGRVSVPLARMMAVVLVVGALAGAYALGPTFALYALAYLIVTAAYSAWLKHIVLIDAFGIAAGFVVRAAAGAAVINVPISPWLYTATMLGALLIAVGKRRAELLVLGNRAAEHRANLQGYSIELIDQLMLVLSSAAVVTYALYTFSAENMPRDHSMMLTLPVVLYGLFRYLWLARGESVGAPEEVLFRDRPLQVTLVVWMALAMTILYSARLPG